MQFCIFAAINYSKAYKRSCTWRGQNASEEVVDNYDRAVNIISPETEEQKHIDMSYKKTYDTILKAFVDLGIAEIETVGKSLIMLCIMR